MELLILSNSYCCIYGRLYNEEYPVVCIDEKSVQFFADFRKGFRSKKNGVQYEDYEYIRNGTACIFLFITRFHTPQFHPAEICQRFWKVLGKIFENIKCACPQKTGKRKCIVSSIYMIRQAIFVGAIFPGGGRAFFDMSMTVGFKSE